MDISKQVASLEQAKRLKELGVRQSSIFYHLPDETTRFAGTHYKRETYKEQGGISAPTVAELGEMLPLGCSTKTRDFGYDDWLCYDWDGDNICDKYTTEAEARAAMLIHLLENNLITAQEVNDRMG